MPPATSSGNPKNSIYILMKFMTDEASHRRVQQGINSIAASGKKAQLAVRRTTDALHKEFELLAKEIAKVEDPAKREAFTQRFEQLRVALDQQLRTTAKLPKSLANTYARGAAQVRDMTTEVRVLNASQEEAIRLEKEFEKGGFRESFRWGITGFALTMAGQTMKRMGAQMFAPIGKFAALENKTDPVFRRWEKSTKKMEESVARIGRVMLREVLPAIEKVAALSEQVAAFVEAHPGVAKFALGTGAAAYLGGSFMVGLGQVLSTVAAFKSLRFLAAATAVTAAGGPTATGAAAAASGGLGTTLKFLGGGFLFSKLKTGFVDLAGWLGKLKALSIAGLLTSIVTKLKAFGAVLAPFGAKLVTFLKFLGSFFFGSLTGAVTGGLAGGVAVNEMLSGTKFGQRMGIQPGGKIATVGAYYAGKPFGEETALRWAASIAKAFGYIEDSSEGAKDALNEFGGAFDMVAKDAVALYQDYIDSEAEAKQELEQDIQDVETEYEEQRLEIVKEYSEERSEIEAEYGEQRAEIEEDYERDRLRIVEDYARERAQREQDYRLKMAREAEDFARESAENQAQFVIDQQRLREDLAERLADLESKYNDDIEDAREDHLRKLEKLEQDHQFRVDELVAARDALGLVQEQRRYNLEKSQIEQDYQDRINELKENLARERQEIREDYARRLQELQEHFAIEEQRRKEDYERKMQQAEEEFRLEEQRRAEDHQRELEQRKEQFEERLTQLAEQHSEELQDLKEANENELLELRTAKSKQLQELRQAYERERRERAQQLRSAMQELLGIERQGYKAMEDAARAYANALLAEAERLEQGVAGGEVVGKQHGGYTRGLVMTGEKGFEYILSNPTTRAAEALVGGKLTQANLLRALVSGRRQAAAGMRASQTINVLQRIDFNGALTAAERAQLRKMVRNESRAGVLEAIGAM